MIEPVFNNIEHNLIALIKASEREIKIAVSWITNQRIFNSLQEKLNQGIQVFLLTNNDEINNNSTSYDFNIFIENGGNLYFIKSEYLLHNKFMTIDNLHTITGSYNLTEMAEAINIENIVIIRENEEVTKRYNQEFERLLSHSLKIENFERVERTFINTSNFYKPPSIESNTKRFEIINVDLIKKYIIIKSDDGESFFLNSSNGDYHIGQIIHLLKSFEVESSNSFENGFFNVYKWIINPRIIQ